MFAFTKLPTERQTIFWDRFLPNPNFFYRKSFNKSSPKFFFSSNISPPPKKKSSLQNSLPPKQLHAQRRVKGVLKGVPLVRTKDGTRTIEKILVSTVLTNWDMNFNLLKSVYLCNMVPYCEMTLFCLDFIIFPGLLISSRC